MVGDVASAVVLYLEITIEVYRQDNLIGVSIVGIEQSEIVAVGLACTEQLVRAGVHQLLSCLCCKIQIILVVMGRAISRSV